MALAACGGDEAVAPQAEVAQADRPLISRADLYRAPDRIRGRLSPDGAQVAWIAPLPDGPHQGAPNVWAGPADDPAAAIPLTDVAKPGVWFFEWARDNTHILYLRQPGDGGLERLHAVNVGTRMSNPLLRDVTPAGGGSKFIGLSWDRPTEVVAKVMPAPGDETTGVAAYAVDLDTGEAERLAAAAMRFDGFVADNALRVRLGERRSPRGGLTIFARNDNGAWIRRALARPGAEVIGFDGSDSRALLLAPNDEGVRQLLWFDPETGDQEPVAAVAGVDVVGVLRHPTTFEVDAVALERLSADWVPLTNAAAQAFAAIRRTLPDRLIVLGRSVDDSKWMIHHSGLDRPGEYHVYDAGLGGLDRLFDIHPQLAGRRLGRSTPVVIPTRDGLELTGYLTLPADSDPDGDGRPDAPLPIVVAPQTNPGGRWSDDFEPFRHLLADRGYAALTLNTRGSNAGDVALAQAGLGALGEGVQDDLVDAVLWAEAQGVARRGLAASLGVRAGGYAAVQALVRDPDLFACAAVHEPTLDLPAAITALEPRESSALQAAVGSSQAARERSLSADDAPAAPVLITLDANAPPELTEPAAAFVEAVNARGGRGWLMRAPKLGGIGTAPEAARAQAAVLEHVLAECLGGQAEPMGDALANAAADILIAPDGLTP